MLLSVILSAIPAHSAHRPLSLKITRPTQLMREPHLDPAQIFDPAKAPNQTYLFDSCVDGLYRRVRIDGVLYAVEEDFAEALPHSGGSAFQPARGPRGSRAQPYEPITVEETMPSLTDLLQNEFVAARDAKDAKIAEKKNADMIKSWQDEFRALRAKEDAALGGAPLPKASANGAPIRVTGRVAFNQLARRWALAATSELRDKDFVWMHILNEGACMTAFNEGCVYKGCYYRKSHSVGEKLVAFETRCTKPKHPENRQLLANFKGRDRFKDITCWEYVKWKDIKDPDLIDVVVFTATDKDDFRAWSAANNYDISHWTF